MSRKTERTGGFMDFAVRTLLIFTILLSAVTLYQNTEIVLSLKAYSVFGYMALITAGVAVLLFLSAKYNIPEKVYLLLTVFFSLVPRLCFSLFVRTPVSGDFLLIYNAAADTVEGDFGWLEKSFFSVWGYQIPFVYYEALILRITGSVLVLKLLNTAYMVVTNVMIYLIVREYEDPRIAFISAVLYALYPAPVLLSSVLTNQHISLMFFMLGIYLYLKSSSWHCTILSGVFLFLGNLMRPEAVLIIAAMFIYTIIRIADRQERMNVKNTLLKTLSVFIVFAFLTGTSSVLFRVTGAAPDGISNNCPEWKFVLGLDTESNGLYNEKNAYIISEKDPRLRNSEARKIISASFEKCPNVLSFFWEKTKIMWAGMETTSWSLRHIETNRPVWNEITNFTYKDAINNILYFDKAIYIMIHIMVTVSCIVMLINHVSRQNRRFFLFVALIAVNYIMYLFIEIQTRYRYFIMPSFFILAAVLFKACLKRFGTDFDNSETNRVHGSGL